MWFAYKYTDILRMLWTTRERVYMCAYVWWAVCFKIGDDHIVQEVGHITRDVYIAQ